MDLLKHTQINFSTGRVTLHDANITFTSRYNTLNSKIQSLTKLKQEIIFQLWFQIFLSIPRQRAAEWIQISWHRFLKERRRACRLSSFEKTNHPSPFKTIKQRPFLPPIKINVTFPKQLYGEGYDKYCFKAQAATVKKLSSVFHPSSDSTYPK